MGNNHQPGGFVRDNPETKGSLLRARETNVVNGQGKLTFMAAG